MKFNASFILLSALFVAPGCEPMSRPAPPKVHVPAPVASAGDESLISQQRAAYPELVGDRFLCLADFEDHAPVSPSGAATAGPATADRNALAVMDAATGGLGGSAALAAGPGASGTGREQVARFRITPPSPEAARQLVVNVTRTGAAAMDVTLPAGGQLVLDFPAGLDIRPYKLLSMAVYSRSIRDDLTVTIDSDGGSWQAHRVLIQPGWNNVLVDVGRAGDGGSLDASKVRRLSLSFPDAAGAVWFNLDDVILIDNARRIAPAPPGVELLKSGLDYTLRLPGWPRPIRISQGADGLWRAGGIQADVRLAGPGEKLPESGEKLDRMGNRCVGELELLEHNAMRLRLVGTWYFASRAGQWASMAARRIRWEYTIYCDGRCVVQGELNNAGGREISAVGLYAPVDAAFYGRSVSRSIELSEFAGQAGRWQYLIVPPGESGKVLSAEYLHPGTVRVVIAGRSVRGVGDHDRDGFDESQGCYCLGARAGQCRFVIEPPEGGLQAPMFLVMGSWRGAVSVSSEGRIIRPVVSRADGSVLFRMPGLYSRATAVEVSGLEASSDGR